MILRSFAQNDLPAGRKQICPIPLEFPVLHMHFSSMTVVMTGPSEKDVQKQIKAMRTASARITTSPKTARDFLQKHGYITKTGKLTKKYGG